MEYVNITVGAGGPNATTNYGRLFIVLKAAEISGTSAWS